MSYNVTKSSPASDSDMSMSDCEENDDELDKLDPDAGDEEAMVEEEDDLSSIEEQDWSDNEDEEDSKEEDDDDEVNMQAYVTADSGDESLKTEQGGVLHVVHGWIQQGQREKVSNAAVVAIPC